MRTKEISRGKGRHHKVVEKTRHPYPIGVIVDKFTIPFGACPFVSKQEQDDERIKRPLFLYNGEVMNGRIDIVRVKLERHITNIGCKTFRNCTALWRVNLCHVVNVDTEAFYGCTSLSRVRFCAVRKIGHWAFKLCVSLEVVLVESNFTVICYHAFAHCDELKWVKFSNGIHHVSEEAFYCCGRLFNMGVPENSFIIDWGRELCDAPSCHFLGNVTMTRVVPNAFTLVSADLGDENSPLTHEAKDSINRIIQNRRLSKEERVRKIRSDIKRIRMFDASTWLTLAIRKHLGVGTKDVESVIIPGVLPFLTNGW